MHERCETASIRVPGGPGAPGAARLAVAARLRGRLESAREEDVALVVSELVTNSVRHADVGTGKEVVIHLLIVGDRLRVAVVDPGSSSTPRRVDRHPGEGGLGLRLVERLASACGVARNGAGTTRVWCEFRLP